MKNRSRLAKMHRCSQTPSCIANFFFSLTNLCLAREVLTGVYRRIYRYRGLLTRNGIKSTCRYPICRKIIFCSNAVLGLYDSSASTAFLTLLNDDESKSRFIENEGGD